MTARRLTAVFALVAAAFIPLPAATASSTAPSQASVPPGTVSLSVSASQQWAIALSPGRVYYTNGSGADLPLVGIWDVRMRTMTTGPGTVAVGPEQAIRDQVFPAALSGSAGRLVFDGDWQRTYTGQVVRVNAREAAPPEASGNRWLIRWNIRIDPGFYEQGRSTYDVRTGRTASTSTWPQGPQDLFGDYLLYTRNDGTVRLRNLRTGTETVPRGAGTPIEAVALHARWAAWVTRCVYAAGVCSQLLTVRDLSTGATRNYNTRNTTSLDLSGGYLGFDATWTTTRALRAIRMDTGAVTVVDRLPQSAADGGHWESAVTPPRHFDLEDEVIGWLDQNHVGMLAHLAPTIDPPRYLGNAIAAPSFTTTWSIAAPVSKALPRCTVTITRGAATVRTLGCANTNGMVAVTWDGRSGGGSVLPAGTYRYRVSGTDDDGYWLRDADGRLRAVTGTVTKR